MLDKVVGPVHFALGPRPTLIDFCLFTGYYAHQYRDPGEAQQFMKRETPALCYYLDNLHAAQCTPDDGELEITDELRAYLQVIGPPSAGFAEGIQQGAAKLAGKQAPNEIFEESIADCTFDMMGSRFSRAGSTFSAWKLQRIRDVFNDLSHEQQERAAGLLAGTGWIEVLESDPGIRLQRVDHQTRLAGEG